MHNPHGFNFSNRPPDITFYIFQHIDYYSHVCSIYKDTKLDACRTT